MENLKMIMVPLIFIFGICAAVLIVSALRNRVMLKMAARNLPRRRANTALIILGLMLAAMIFSASFATGDTLTHSIRSLAVDYLGEVDTMVMREGVEFGVIQMDMEGNVETKYFEETEFDNVRNSLSGLVDDSVVEGVAPAIIETVPVIAPQTKLNEPAVTLLGLDHRYMAAFDPLLDQQGQQLSLKALEERGDGYIYINTALAEELEVGVNDTIDAYLSEEGTPLIVAGMYETGGNPTTFSFDTSASIVAPLSYIQSLRTAWDREGDINFIIISNQGGVIKGAEHTDAVMVVLEPSLEGTNLKAEPIKQDALDNADEGGAMFTTMFFVFGMFSIIAGVLLIFLIFVMLAAERKPELGMARAIGTQQGHIVRMFTYEGVLYALVASAIGAGLGLVFSWGMVQVMTAAFEEMGFELTYRFTPSGMIISYTLGVLLTLLVVFISARRVSTLNIISAIKDLPEPQRKGEQSIRSLLRSAYRFRLIMGFLPIFWIRINPGAHFRLSIALIPMLLPLYGLIILVSGLQQKHWAPYTLGASLLIIGVCLLARRFRLPDRAAYTLAGVGLLVFWLLPFDVHPYSEEMSSGIEMFILSGVMLVAGGVWVIMYNSDLLLGAVMSVFGRIRALTPILKTAVTYPMASRFRTGMVLAMFSLVVFTLVVMSTINASFEDVLDDTDRVAGGFHIRGEVSPNNPIPDIETAIIESETLDRDDFTAIAGFSVIPTKIRDADSDQEWEDMILVGVDEGYTENVNYDFEIITAGYSSREQVWQALMDNPSLAVVNASIVPSRDEGFGDDDIDLMVGEGKFVIEDDILPDDIYIEVQNPFTGATQELQVIGVVDIMAGPYSAGVTTSQDTLNAIAGFSAPPFAYRFQVTPENIENVPLLAKSLEKGFLENGMNTEVMAEEIEDFGRMNAMFMNLMMAFMGLGLIVGIAALGVIAARSVVERRQQIGMLRAIGFRQGMVQLSFLIESSFVALLGISLGSALGLAIAFLIIPDSGVEGIKTIVPLGQIVLIGALAYLASLLTTFLPAYQASRIYPAEALRYE